MLEYNRLYTGDCLKVLPDIPAGSVDLIFADPPFNIGYGYDVYEDRKSSDLYLEWTRTWVWHCKRVLAETGSMWVAIGDEYAAQMKMILDGSGLNFRSWVIWHYTFGVNQKSNFSRSHTHLFYYTADPKLFTYNGDSIMVRSARQTLYKDKRQKPGGRLPDNTWVLRPEKESRAYQQEMDTWSVSRVCGTFKERVEHPCQMPEEILERIVRVSSNDDDVVLDPFAGSGTTLAVAQRLGRRWFGIEMSEQYCAVIRKRLANVKEPKKERDLTDWYEEQCKIYGKGAV